MPLTRKLSTKSLIKQNTSQDSSNSANQTITKNTFTASGVGPYSLTVSPISVNNTQVYINGVYQEKNNYTLAGNQITFSVAPPSGTSIEVISGSSYNIGTPSDGSVTTAKISSGAAAAGTLLTANGSGGVSFTNAFPTIQRLTSGTTYNTPANCKYIRVKMVGGGGGGAGGAQNLSNNGGNGGNGGNTTFGAATANGGSGALGGTSYTLAAAGGSGSLGGYTGYVIQGGQGCSGASSSTGPNMTTGGHGGNSVFVGNGVGRNQSAGTAAYANSGSGGGGGSGSNATNISAGTGGGAGGYVEFIIPNPSSTYSYSIGTGGTAGAAGTNGAAGGAGGDGVIIVEEYYQ
jgi:hypothetical protein